MEASAIAAMASSNALAQVQQEASVEVLRKALDIVPARDCRYPGRERNAVAAGDSAPSRAGGGQHRWRNRQYLGLSGPARMHRNAQIGCRVFLHLNPGATNYDFKVLF